MHNAIGTNKPESTFHEKEDGRLVLLLGLNKKNGEVVIGWVFEPSFCLCRSTDDRSAAPLDYSGYVLWSKEVSKSQQLTNRFCQQNEFWKSTCCQVQLRG